MKGIIIDTGVFYALLDKSDTYHQQAQSELNIVIEKNLTIYVSFPVFLETYSLLLYRLGFMTAKAFTDYCDTSVEFINPNQKQYLQAKNKVIQYPDQKITLVDGMTAILSIQMNLDVWTYDYHFDIMGVQVWP